MQIRASSQQQQLTAQCTHCTTASPDGISPYIEILSTVRSFHKPTHCPTCGHTRLIREYDYADCLVWHYWGCLTRKGAVHAITQYNELSLQGKLSKACRDALDFPATIWGFKPMLSAQPITPLTVSCTSCAGQYTLLRSVNPSVQQTPPLYCVWCGLRTCTISVDNTEETAWLSLANHYHLSVQAVQFFYAHWTALPPNSYPSFSSYLTSDNVAPLVTAAQQSNQPS